MSVTQLHNYMINYTVYTYTPYTVYKCHQIMLWAYHMIKSSLWMLLVLFYGNGSITWRLTLLVLTMLLYIGIKLL